MSTDDAISRAAKRKFGWEKATRTWNRLFDPTNDHDEIYEIEGYAINGDEFTGKFYASAQSYIRFMVSKGTFKSCTVNLIPLDPSVKYFYSDKFFSEQAPKRATKQVVTPRETHDS